MKKNKKRFTIKIVILTILVGISVVAISIFQKSKEKTENNTKAVENAEIQKQAENNNTEIESKKVNFLANVTEPVYKIGEKNIKIPIIIYHAFNTPEPPGDIYKLFSTQQRFEENVTTLLNDGYTFITLEDLYNYNKGEIGLPEKVCIITMDDGWLGSYTEAFPVLQKYNIPATIFIVRDLVRNRWILFMGASKGNVR